MDLLDVSLDALAFRLYSLPVAAAAIGSAWACLALLAAAALGLWSIRAVSSKSDPPPCPSSASRPPPPGRSFPSCPTALQTPEGRELAVAARPAACHGGEASTPKARFTAYYAASAASHHVEDDAHGEHADEDEEEEGGSSIGDVDRRVTAPWNGGWVLEWTAVKRRGDLGWHRYQDMKALNGSVVKLWDARDSRSTATAGGRLRRRL